MKKLTINENFSLHRRFLEKNGSLRTEKNLWGTQNGLFGTFIFKSLVNFDIMVILTPL